MTGEFSWVRAAQEIRERRERFEDLRRRAEACTTPMGFGDAHFLSQVLISESPTDAEFAKAEEILDRYVAKDKP